jgi:hypothetical protein
MAIPLAHEAVLFDGGEFDGFAEKFEGTKKGSI